MRAPSCSRPASTHIASTIEGASTRPGSPLSSTVAPAHAMISAPSTAPHILRYLAIVKVAQRAGLSLDEVLDALGQYQPGVHLTAAHWRRVASRWREDLDDRITQLMRLRDELGGCIGCGCLSLKECLLRNPGDILAGQGPGARILERE